MPNRRGQIVSFTLELSPQMFQLQLHKEWFVWLMGCVVWCSSKGILWHAQSIRVYAQLQGPLTWLTTAHSPVCCSF